MFYCCVIFSLPAWGGRCPLPCFHWAFFSWLEPSLMWPCHHGRSSLIHLLLGTDMASPSSRSQTLIWSFYWLWKFSCSRLLKKLINIFQRQIELTSQKCQTSEKRANESIKGNTPTTLTTWMKSFLLFLLCTDLWIVLVSHFELCHILLAALIYSDASYLINCS